MYTLTGPAGILYRMTFSVVWRDRSRRPVNRLIFTTSYSYLGLEIFSVENSVSFTHFSVFSFFFLQFLSQTYNKNNKCLHINNYQFRLNICFLMEAIFFFFCNIKITWHYFVVISFIKNIKKIDKIT